MESLPNLRTLTLGSPRLKGRTSGEWTLQMLTRLLQTPTLKHLSLCGSVTTPENWRQVWVPTGYGIETLQLSAQKPDGISNEETSAIIASVGHGLKHLHLNAFTNPYRSLPPSQLQTLRLGPSMRSLDISEALRYFSRVSTLRAIELVPYPKQKPLILDLLRLIQDELHEQDRLEPRRFVGLVEFKLTIASGQGVPPRSIMARRDQTIRRYGNPDTALLIVDLLDRLCEDTRPEDPKGVRDRNPKSEGDKDPGDGNAGLISHPPSVAPTTDPSTTNRYYLNLNILPFSRCPSYNRKLPQ